MGSLRFILGRAGTGKTRYCVDMVARELRRSPLVGPTVVLLVPEQATFQMSRMLAGWRNLRGYIRGKVVSFKSLAQMAVNAAGETKKPMLGYSRRLVMQQVIAAMQGELKFWNASRPERIAGAILNLLDELTQAELTPEQLDEIYRERMAKGELGREFADKLSDIIHLAEQYRKMDLAGFDDPLVYLDRYRELIGGLDWLREARICVDGFSGFAGQEYAALVATIAAARETHLTLSLDPDRLGAEPVPEELNSFWPSEQTYFRLLELAKGAGIEVKEPVRLDSSGRRRYRHGPLLCGLEQYLAGRGATHPGGQAIAFEEISSFRHTIRHGLEDDAMPSGTVGGRALLRVSAEDPAHEVELAAGKILQLAREKSYRFHEMSVIVRSLEGYEHLIRYFFEQNHIPYFLDIRRPIAHHPLTRMIQSAVGVLATGFDTRWVLRYAKSGMTNLPEAVVDRLENYVLAHGIDGERWLGEWRYRLTLQGRDDEAAAAEEWNLQAVNEHRVQLVRPLQRLAKSIGVREGETQAFSIHALIDGLMQFLHDMNVTRKLDELQAESSRWDGGEDGRKDQTSQIHAQIWNVLIELMSQLRVTLAGRDLTLEQFLNVLTDSFAELTVGVIPLSADQVLVGSIDRTRHPDVKVCLVLGFNEGLWPQPPQTDVVLTDEDRERLAWQDLPTPGNAGQHYLREQYLTYIAFTRPADFLWISYARRSLLGLAMSPSRYLRRIVSFCGPELVVSREADRREVVFNSETPMPVNRSRLAGEVVTGLRTQGGGPEGTFWLGLAESLNADTRARGPLRKFIEGLCDENGAHIAPEVAGKLFLHRVSFSQLESFFRCPFQHFCRYGLRLTVTPRYRLEPVDLGRFRHEVMAAVWVKIMAKGETWRQTGDEEVRRIVDQAIDEHAEKIRSQVLLSRARNRYILDRTRFELSLAVGEQLRTLRGGQFVPGSFEQDFSYPLAVEGAGYELIGRIDRLDQARRDNRPWVLVIDYKSGPTTFKLRDWYAGVQMQLPGYLMVSTGGDEVPAGAVFLPLVPRKPKSDGCFFPASGLVGLDALDSLRDPETGVYPYCIRVKKDGQPAVTGPTAILSPEELGAVLRRTREMVQEGLKAMAKGEIGIHPYYDGAVSVCPMCDHRGVCRFDKALNRYRVIARAGKEEVLAEIQKHETAGTQG